MLRFAIFDRYIADINELHNFYIVLNYCKNFLGIFKLKINMLNENEKAVAHITSAISIFSIRQNDNTVAKNISMVDFILKTIPEDIKPIITIDLIDNVFSYISATYVDT